MANEEQNTKEIVIFWEADNGFYMSSKEYFAEHAQRWNLFEHLLCHNGFIVSE